MLSQSFDRYRLFDGDERVQWQNAFYRIPFVYARVSTICVQLYQAADAEQHTIEVMLKTDFGSDHCNCLELTSRTVDGGFFKYLNRT